MEIIDYARLGRPFEDVLLIDAHCHLGCGRDFNIPYRDLKEQFRHFRRTMDMVGVDYACVSMLKALSYGDLGANFELMALMETDRRILGWAVYNPFIPEAQKRQPMRQPAWVDRQRLFPCRCSINTDSIIVLFSSFNKYLQALSFLEDILGRLPK